MSLSIHCPSQAAGHAAQGQGDGGAEVDLGLLGDLLPTDTMDMANTVMEDSTPMVSTSKPPSRSIRGLMMTPPPIPVSEPTVVAPMAIRK